MRITSGLLILIHGIITLSDTISYDKTGSLTTLLKFDLISQLLMLNNSCALSTPVEWINLPGKGLEELSPLPLINSDPKKCSPP